MQMLFRLFVDCLVNTAPLVRTVNFIFILSVLVFVVRLLFVYTHYIIAVAMLAVP